MNTVQQGRIAPVHQAATQGRSRSPLFRCPQLSPLEAFTEEVPQVSSTVSVGTGVRPGPPGVGFSIQSIIPATIPTAVGPMVASPCRLHREHPSNRKIPKLFQNAGALTPDLLSQELFSRASLER